MLLAGFPPDRPLPSDAGSLPHVRRFLEDWGRPDDVGVVAVAERPAHQPVVDRPVNPPVADRPVNPPVVDRPVGAAWARRLEDPLLRDDAGVAVAEVAIAVEEGYRGAGTGTALLCGLEREAAARGHRALALAVSPRNPARRLYERVGYEVVAEDERGLVMRRRLA